MVTDPGPWSHLGPVQSSIVIVVMGVVVKVKSHCVDGGLIGTSACRGRKRLDGYHY